VTLKEVENSYSPLNLVSFYTLYVVVFVFVFFFDLGLPNDLMKDLQEVNSQFQRVKEKIQKLEEVLSKARKLQEQKLILQAGSKYLPMEEIEMIIQKSDAKIEDAKILHKLIEELRKKSGYMTESEIKSLAETLQMLETRLKMGGSFSDGNSATICNENNDEDGNRVDHEEDADNNNDKIDDDGEVDDIDDDDN
jgi:hypothetical protein